MARAEKHNADYFPFLCNEGNNTKYIEATYGNDGFAVWVKILRQLTVNNYHYIDLSIKPRLMTFSSVCKVPEDRLITIINDLAELEEIDKTLWCDYRIIWSDKFIENIQDAYKNRKNKIVKKAEFIKVYERLTGKKLPVNGVSYPGNTHSIVEYSKEDNSKEDYAGVFDDPVKVDPTIMQKASDLTDAICDYFDVKKILTSKIYNSIFDFVSTVTHRNELDMVSIALQKYMAYKARSQEQRHGVEKWIGTKENHYQDGHWTMTNWDSKLSKLQNASPSRTLTETSPNPGKDYSEKF